jgi:hypothetical protein
MGILETHSQIRIQEVKGEVQEFAFYQVQQVLLVALRLAFEELA